MDTKRRSFLKLGTGAAIGTLASGAAFAAVTVPALVRML